ncbi:ABC transporter substrate-binding protein [Sagittula sp. SSi028]|uniref:ABC transporter substrate-binding protein n=1 Tax=Sagittula sp. SSi028 TaxID=3400636 RepID=UPI003AF693CD
MTTKTDPRRLPRVARSQLADFEHGRLSRREFLTRITALGVPAALAYTLGGLPARAQDIAAAQTKRTMRIQQEVRPMKDPRTFDWTQIANFARGWLEYLVEYRRDGSLHGMLLRDWEVNDNATEYLLHLREGVTWTTGEPFTAEDVQRVFAYWADTTVEGNSMAARLGALIDPATGQLRPDAVEIVTPMQVRLHLSRPDVTLMVNLADYPAAVVHSSHTPETMLTNPVGTGPYLPESYVFGERAVLVRNDEHDWWGHSAEGYGGATLERIEFIDYGTDPASWIAAIQADEVDLLYQNVGEFIGVADELGLRRSDVATSATVVVRFNQQAMVDGQKIYADPALRRAMVQAVDNAICLELGYDDQGIVAANHHVAPIQPDFADIGPAVFDPDGTAATIAELGLEDLEHVLVSLDDGFTRKTADAVATQLRDAGVKVRRQVLPGSAFWADWVRYPFSITEWNHRPLGIQPLALGYRSGAAWNESGYANPDFDAKIDEALSIAEARDRIGVMAELQTILREDHVIIQPYWRSLYRHMRSDVVGAEMHPTIELHPYRLGFRAGAPVDDANLPDSD